MSRLPVSSLDRIVSVECTGCMDCVAVCPRPEALGMFVGRRRVSPLAYGAALMALFMAGYVGARATGVWDNDIADVEYVERIQNMDSGEYGHPGM
jgi:ferredoxin